MRVEPPDAIHATAVAIGSRALLICGPSRAGKSRLALALIARGTPTLPIVLIGDDRIRLHCDGVGLVARPHPRIAGFVERRGLGMVAMPWLAWAPVGGIVDLSGGRSQSQRFAQDRWRAIPRLEIAGHNEGTCRANIVLAWWSNRAARPTATWASHRSEKADGAVWPCAKD